jgi:hypothetical protein
METWDLSSSASWNLWAYVRERFPAWLALPLPLLLVFAALREKSVLPAEFAGAFVMAALLIFELRLWDDLFDLELDRTLHPERVLCRSPSLRPFRGLLFVLMAINFTLVALLRAWWGTALFLTLHVLLAAWYGFRNLVSLGPLANYHVVLLKYPLIVFILGATMATDISAPPLLLSAALVYLAMCIYEVMHDARLRALHGARICLAVDCLLLAAIGCRAVLSVVWFRHSP